MATDIFENMEVVEVWYAKGQYTDKPAQNRYVYAPFQLVKMQANTDTAPEQYIQPRGLGDVDSNYLLSKDQGTDGDEWEVGRTGFGHLSDSRVVMEAHEIGDHDGNSEDWRGLFRIGMI